MPLFAIEKTEEIRLRVAAVAEQQRRNWMHRRALAMRRLQPITIVQPAFWGDPLVIEQSKPIVKHEPAPRAPRSVFELADFSVRTRVRSHGGPIAEAEARTAVTTEGVTRCVGAQYPSNRWTAEREEQERARRARQKPPKPPKGARTKSRKLMELVGED